MINYMPDVLLCLISLNGIIRLVNARYLLKIKHLYRLYLLLFIASFGFLFLSIATTAKDFYGFLLALLSSIFVGLSGAIGESLVLGFLKSFPSHLVVGWSSGTGLAGVYGSGFYLLMQYLKVPDSTTFLIMIPKQCILYLICFFWVNS